MQLLQIISICLKVNKYLKDNFISGTLLNSLRTDNKRNSLPINLRVDNVTGEEYNDQYHKNIFIFHNDSHNYNNSGYQNVSQIDKYPILGRGFVVHNPLRLWKEPKYLNCINYNQFRSYSTRSRTKKLVSVQKQPEVIPKGFEILAKHWFVNNKNPTKIFNDLKGLLKLDSIWFAAYLKITKNKGSKTPGPDGFIIDSLTKNKILEVKTAVLKKEYNWIGFKRIMIPKAGKQGEIRPLGIPTINDRLVQEVLRTIIEPIFEITFSHHSHGFRINRGCHTALRELKTRMKDSVWFIEGDIKSYFDTIDHVILMNLIKRRIKDPLILNLFKTGLKAKVFNNDKTVYIPEIGTPQGGILSPLLSNIYLHELDLFLEKLSIEYKGSVKSNNRKHNPLALKLFRQGLKTHNYRVRIPSRIQNDINDRNCKFVRYADDFLVGVLGPRSMAVEIRDKINVFLKDKLNISLNLDKTKITHISKEIPFLGYKFSRRQLFIKQRYNGKILNRKMTIPTLDVNMEKVISSLADANFCDKSGFPLPIFKFLRLPQSEINDKINFILRGLSEWWKIAGNKKRAVARVAYILRCSVAKLYAAKFKLPTVASVFKIGGHDLSKPIGIRAKSVVGLDEKDIPLNKKKLKGINFDKYHKIYKGNKF